MKCIKYIYLLFYFKVSLLAGALVNLGVVKGDRILIYMPLIPEAIISMLAAVRIGAVHSVVFGGKLNCFSNIKIVVIGRGSSMEGL